MNTLLLDTATWDLTKDASRNIAVASAPYSLAQDVASAIRTWLNEVWYNRTLGVAYENIMGKNPPMSLFQDYMIEAALGAVPNTADVYVASAVCVLQSFDSTTRKVSGQVQFVDSTGTPGNVSF